MAFSFKKFWAGLQIVPKTTSTANAKGDLEVIDSTGKLGYHNGISVSAVVTEAHSATLTNKTIDADSNTITNIENADIKAAAAIDASKLADGSVSNTEFQYISTVTSNVQDQIDSKATATGLSDHINDTVDAHDASAISVSAISGLTATEVQAALAEHQVEIENTYNDLGAHITDTIDAHDASAVSSIPSGNLAATDVQAALNELQSDIDTRATTSALGAHTGATSAHGVSGAIVGTSDSQVLTNKTITGADIRTPVRSDVKQDTKANLVTYASTASNGQMVFATDTKELYQIKDSALAAVGSSGVGGTDILFVQDFETAALTDFTQTGLSLSTSSPLDGLVSALLTHQPATSQSFKQVTAVDEKFRGQAMTIGLDLKSTATAGNVTISVYDETNAAAILASTQLTLASTTGGIKDTVAFTIPATCLSMSYTITALQEAGSPVTRVDDIICQIANSSLLETSVTVPKMTAWASYTPTLTGFGTATSIQADWRQVGQNHEYRIKFVSGTSTGVEARASLANGATSADTARIPSIQMIGSYINGATSTNNHGGGVFIEPSVAYLTFGNSVTYGSTSTDPSAKVVGSSVASASANIEIFASVPIQGLAATEDVTIPLTQSGIVQEADSYIKLDTFNTFGSTANKIARFTNTVSVLGSDITYTDSVVNGASFTVNTDGVYSFEFSMPAATGVSSSVALSKNTSGADLTTIPTSLTSDKILSLSYTPTVAGTSGNPVAAWTGYLIAGDIVRPHTGGSTPATVAWAHFSGSKQGSLKQVTVNTNSKITIPTSELRFEGASARGAVATAIVKFDTMAKIRGDAFTVTNTANDGTYVTMTKAGKLDVSASVTFAASGTLFAITKSQATLTTTPTASEIMSDVVSGSAGLSINGAASIFVKVGDVIRIYASSVPSASANNVLNLSFQEQDIQVSVSNTLPQFSESDSSVSVDAANGYGSTGTKIRRFSNLRTNVGVDVTYVDSATAGASFTAMTSGIYEVSYSDNFNAAARIGITKNQPDLTLSIGSQGGLTILRAGGTTAAGSVTASWSGYLVAGDVIRPCTDGVPTGSDSGFAGFTMSKVGKPNVTGVDVTPFVVIPQPVSQSSVISNTSSVGPSTSITGALTSSVGSGLYSYDSSTGIYTILKNCKVIATISQTASTNLQVGASILIDNIIAARDYSTALTGYSASSTWVGQLNAGQNIRLQNITAGTSTINYGNILATATSDQILTAPETFSTDTAPLVYAGSGTYTLATLANAPVGTFLTFVYTASTTATKTQTTTAPTQTTSDMNANGILITSRAYAGTGTSALPPYFAIQIGKGLKGQSYTGYTAAGKTGNILSGDSVLASLSILYGFMIKEYDAVTGILVLDAGTIPSAAHTTHGFFDSAGNIQASGYWSVNASKNPALTGLGLGTVAARGVNTAGTSIPTGTQTVVVFDAAKTYDTHGALNTSTGVFTAPESGYYIACANAEFTNQTYAIGNTTYGALYQNGVAVAYGVISLADRAATLVFNCPVSSGVRLVMGDTLEFRIYNNRTAGATTLQTGLGSNYFSIHKTSIGSN